MLTYRLIVSPKQCGNLLTSKPYHISIQLYLKLNRIIFILIYYDFVLFHNLASR